MSKAKIIKARITPERAKQISLKSKKEADDFYKNHFLKDSNKSNDLIFTIKHHLYIENLMDGIFCAIFPKADQVLKFSFSQKVNLIEALNISPSERFIDVLKLINRLRNRFAHNISYKVSKKDIDSVVSFLKLPKTRTVRRHLRMIFQYAIGYLHFMRNACTLFPLGMILISFSSKIRRDKCYAKGMFNSIYPWDSVKEILDNMKL